MKVQSVNDRHQIAEKLSIQDFKILGLIAEGHEESIYQAPMQRYFKRLINRIKLSL